jgi:hypothetical protein
MIKIRIGCEYVTVSDRDAYLADYGWRLIGDIAVLDSVPEYRSAPKRLMVENILDALGFAPPFKYLDGNPYNLCRSNLIGPRAPLVRRHKRWCLIVDGRTVCSAREYEDAMELRRKYYDDC